MDYNRLVCYFKDADPIMIKKSIVIHGRSVGKLRNKTALFDLFFDLVVFLLACADMLKELSK